MLWNFNEQIMCCVSAAAPPFGRPRTPPRPVCMWVLCECCVSVVCVLCVFMYVCMCVCVCVCVYVCVCVCESRERERQRAWFKIPGMRLIRFLLRWQSETPLVIIIVSCVKRVSKELSICNICYLSNNLEREKHQARTNAC